jgi:hypothetical protein
MFPIWTVKIMKWRRHLRLLLSYGNAVRKRLGLLFTSVLIKICNPAVITYASEIITGLLRLKHTCRTMKIVPYAILHHAFKLTCFK